MRVSGKVNHSIDGVFGENLVKEHVVANIALNEGGACSSTGENGTGVCGGVTMMIGALRW